MNSAVIRINKIIKVFRLLQKELPRNITVIQLQPQNIHIEFFTGKGRKLFLSLKIIS
jgi:hypothetical protein